MNFFRLLIGTIALGISTISIAQTHENFWIRATFAVPIGNHFKIDNELQLRRQSNFDNHNPFSKPLMLSFRPWIHYQKKQFQASLSPIAFYSSERIIQSNLDLNNSSMYEIRSSLALEFKHSFSTRWSISQRNAIEYRNLISQEVELFRLRSKTSLTYSIFFNLKLSLQEELLVNQLLQKNTTPFYDHNRIGLLIEYAFHPDMKFEIGYMRINRIPLFKSTAIQENNFILQFRYQLPSKKQS